MKKILINPISDLNKARLSNPDLPPNRQFGIFAIFAFLFGSGLLYFWFNQVFLSMICATVALLFALMLLIRKEWLTPFNIGWFRLGLLIGRFINPLVLGLIYFFLFVPLGITLRLFGRDELNIIDLELDSNWKPKINDRPIKDNFHQQF